MAIESVDLWGHVQRQVFQTGPIEVSNVRLLPQSTTVHIFLEEGWYSDRQRSKADEVFAALEDALGSGRARKADRLRAQWLHHVHLDRMSYARETARERGLRFDPVGRGPVVDSPTVHYRDRLPWYLTPVSRYSDERLPDHACDVMETWNGCGGVFDGLYVVDEPVSSGHFPVHSLIGAISPDGRTGDWFVLDRWAG